MAELVYNEQGRLLFTEEMRKEYTILIPMMLPIHFTFLEKIFNNHGYKVELLKTTGRQIVDEGLKNVHNDTCYPALLVIGQMLDALKSGKYDLHNRPDDNSDRRRLPCVQLYPSAEKGARAQRNGVCPR